jgi:hypothetical protein
VANPDALAGTCVQVIVPNGEDPGPLPEPEASPASVSDWLAMSPTPYDEGQALLEDSSADIDNAVLAPPREEHSTQGEGPATEVGERLSFLAGLRVIIGGTEDQVDTDERDDVMYPATGCDLSAVASPPAARASSEVLADLQLPSPPMSPRTVGMTPDRL